jgi:hypothetical protein
VRLDLRLAQGRASLQGNPYSPDGRRLLLTSASLESSEIWSLENVLPVAVKNSAGQCQMSNAQRLWRYNT